MYACPNAEASSLCQTDWLQGRVDLPLTYPLHNHSRFCLAFSEVFQLTVQVLLPLEQLLQQQVAAWHPVLFVGALQLQQQPPWLSVYACLLWYVSLVVKGIGGQRCSRSPAWPTGCFWLFCFLLLHVL